MGCQYCEKGQDLSNKMVPVGTYRGADIYLFRDQTHKGKCIVVWPEHKTEWHQLNETERANLSAAMAATAKAVQEIFGADKINYATFGDKLNHLHIHITPKYEGGPDWGAYFRDDRPALTLSEAEYTALAAVIAEKLQSIDI